MHAKASDSQMFAAMDIFQREDKNNNKIVPPVI